MTSVSPPLISVVMPVYNVARFLPQCLESLIALESSIDEIIVVDDGSTDDCPQILAEYATRLPQMRVIRQENKGLSEARNTGLDHAKGKYLAFIDSDDFLSTDAYQRALTRAEAENLEMVIFNGVYHHEGRKEDKPIYELQSATGIISGKAWLKQRLSINKLPHMVWMHLYRRDFLAQGGWRFVPNLIHEDVIWTTQVLLAAKRIAYEPAIYYHYRIPLRTFSPEQNQTRLERIINSSIYNAKTLATMANAHGKDPELSHLIRFQLVDGALSVFHKLKKMPDAATRKRLSIELRKTGWFGFLWENAQKFSQRRKIARHFLVSFMLRN